MADIEGWLKLVASAAGLVMLVLGAGKAWGSLTTRLDAIQSTGAEGTRSVGALHTRFEDFKHEIRGEVTALRVADAQLEGRVELVERMQGLPPPWKRTQPIQAVRKQDVFASPEDEQQ